MHFEKCQLYFFLLEIPVAPEAGFICLFVYWNLCDSSALINFLLGLLALMWKGINIFNFMLLLREHS